MKSRKMDPDGDENLLINFISPKMCVTQHRVGSNIRPMSLGYTLLSNRYSVVDTIFSNVMGYWCSFQHSCVIAHFFSKKDALALYMSSNQRYGIMRNPRGPRPI